MAKIKIRARNKGPRPRTIVDMNDPAEDQMISMCALVRLHRTHAEMREDLGIDEETLSHWLDCTLSWLRSPSSP
jgi:hypothetical protein